MLLSPNTLPGLFERRGGHRGQQNPFQGVFPFRRVFLPDPDRPHLQRLAGSLAVRCAAAAPSACQTRAGPGSHEQLCHGWRARPRGGHPATATSGLHRAAESTAHPPLVLAGSQTLAPENGSASPGRRGRSRTGRPRDLPRGPSWSPLESFPSGAPSASTPPFPAPDGCGVGPGAHLLGLACAPRVPPWHSPGPRRSRAARPGPSADTALCCQCGCSSARTRHILFIQQSVQGDGLFPRLPLGWQGRRGILRQPSGRFHGTSRSVNILEPSRPKGLLGPAFWVQDVLCVHLPILAGVKCG
jgi:hypothetical protein